MDLPALVSNSIFEQICSSPQISSLPREDLAQELDQKVILGPQDWSLVNI